MIGDGCLPYLRLKQTYAPESKVALKQGNTLVSHLIICLMAWSVIQKAASLNTLLHFVHSCPRKLGINAP
jgi:hypothetical protein